MIVFVSKNLFGQFREKTAGHTNQVVKRILAHTVDVVCCERTSERTSGGRRRRWWWWWRRRRNKTQHYRCKKHQQLTIKDHNQKFATVTVIIFQPKTHTHSRREREIVGEQEIFYSQTLRELHIYTHTLPSNKPPTNLAYIKTLWAHASKNQQKRARTYTYPKKNQPPATPWNTVRYASAQINTHAHTHSYPFEQSGLQFCGWELD